VNKQHHKLYLETPDKQQTYAVLQYFTIMDECARNVIALLKQQFCWGKVL
jgi:hypothetical protein